MVEMNLGLFCHSDVSYHFYDMLQCIGTVLNWNDVSYRLSLHTTEPKKLGISLRFLQDKPMLSTTTSINEGVVQRFMNERWFLPVNPGTKGGPDNGERYLNLDGGREWDCVYFVVLEVH